MKLNSQGKGIFSERILSNAIMNSPAIIPLPVEMTIHEGEFVINADTQIYYQINLKEQAEYFNMFFQSATNLLLEMVEAESPPDQSVPGMFLGIINKESSQIPFEGYSLQITTFNIQIEGSDVAGVFLWHPNFATSFALGNRIPCSKK